ncbi:MAG: hypothetical protein HKN41_12685 [Ilumatobacter sp.]|nr:hypothetical protein [Ilumatobacter sp.]
MRRSDHLVPATIEDQRADRALERGRNAGGAWIVASALSFAFFLGSGADAAGLIAVGGCVVLLAVGLQVRARFWRSVRREFGDATVQRARWRQADAERESRDRVWWAVGLVALVLASQIWRR